MSDSILRIIPCNPMYVPPVEQQSHATDVLRSYFAHADSVKVETFVTVQFIDAGENWGEIRCPSCDAILDMDWWSGAMGEASEHDFQDLNVTTPCCGSKVSLNTLKYEFEVGFAKFVLEVLNPNKTKLDNSDLSNLEAILGFDIKVVSAFI